MPDARKLKPALLPGPALCLLAALGCGESRPAPPPPPEAPLPTATEFDPASAGAIHGRVGWEGSIPTPAPFRAYSPPLPAELIGSARDRANPNAPLIDPVTHGVGSAVIFLRGVDPRRSRPWDLPPVRVEQRDLRFHVWRGATESHVGFVHRGDSVEMVSTEGVFHALHAGGASYFSLPFPDRDMPLRRKLTERGLVELTSAAGYYWMRAYLFVDEHPYYTRTDPQGRFTLERVPPGDYEVVCWMPSWVEDRHERDPEWGFITRLSFRKPVEVLQRVGLEAGQSREVRFTVSAKLFER